MVNIREKAKPRSGIYSNYRKSKGKPALYIALFLIVIFIMAIVYRPNKEPGRMKTQAPQGTVSASGSPAFTKQGELTFLKSDSTVIAKIDIEIADDDDKRERGLMFRREMALDNGMLFIFEDLDQRSFWMKNTYLPLDILYLDDQKSIVRIHENVATLNEQPILSDFPAKYVVEVNAGFCALYRIQPGDRIDFIRR